jgi:hypothetical protein
VTVASETADRLQRRAPAGCFHLAWPPWQPPGADGLAAIVTAGASTGWADGLLARTGDGLVVWAATSTDAEGQALARLHYPGVRAVTLTPAKSDPRRVRLALELAAELAAARSNGACLTSWAAPAPPPGVVRIPHLVTVQRDGAVTETVVWELAPVAVAQHWLGGPLPDQLFFETRLDALLRLRGAARRGQLPATAVAAGLAELIPDRDLSIRVVYEHAAAFRGLLLGHPDGHPS